MKFIRRKQLLAACLLCVATAIGASAQTFTTLASFGGRNGSRPYGELVQGTDGNFYGTTLDGANLTCGGGCGTVFRVTPTGTLNSLHRFDMTDGAYPYAGLVLGTDGDFYGTTAEGGGFACGLSIGCGLVFKITPRGEVTTIYSFCSEATCTDGDYPTGTLVQAPNGNFYGTTASGGVNCVSEGGCGTVFEVTASGILTTLYSFCAQPNCIDGEGPRGALVQATDGSFYGTTYIGGANNDGTIFKITPSGTLTTIHSFDGTDGSSPYAGLALAIDGDFYGTTYNGGNKDKGTIFKINAAGKLTTLYNFCSTTKCGDGGLPYAGLIQATDGNFYGTTQWGGTNLYGTVFGITGGGTLTTLHSFDGTDGSFPYGGMVQATDGSFYGTTSTGGTGGCIYSCGTVFSLSAGLVPFVAFVQSAGRNGETIGILGQGFTGTTAASFNGTPASFTVRRDTYVIATVPAGATTGYVTVTTPSGTLTSNVPFHVLP